jgi:NAD(P)-dependent dehydrogenase (short-subunit alcohol dehydrogenase family)
VEFSSLAPVAAGVNGWVDNAHEANVLVFGREISGNAARDDKSATLPRAKSVLATVAFLASEAASYITGQLIVIDSGNS